MNITLHGAAGGVTGSAYLVETANARFLIDFGLFQGSHSESKNVIPAGLEPLRLDAVLLTHAHLDHTGRLPLLVRNGFGKAIHATTATIELAALIMRDSAKVQLQDVDHANRKRQRSGKPLLEPIYRAEHVEQTLERFVSVELDRPFEPIPGVVAEYFGAGHMLGSASIQITVRERGVAKKVLFSGDIGPDGLALIPPPNPREGGEFVFMESTYGDRNHKPIGETLKEFREIIQQAVKAKARIIVPAFAVGRTQQLVYHLDELFCSGELEPFPVYIDSPMAIAATEIYRKHPDLFDIEAQDMLRVCDIARRHGHVRATSKPAESMALNDVPGPCLIMAGAGMCNGGRILHHLRHGLWHEETVVLIVGYQSEGTLGRQLVDGAETVHIFGEEIAVRAQIHTLNGFSAHAGQSELLRWFQSISSPKPTVALTHGEARGREPLAKLLRERHRVEPLLPMQGDVIRL